MLRRLCIFRRNTLHIHIKPDKKSKKRCQADSTNIYCHEIRTPLNSIVGFSDLIFNDEIDKETREGFSQEIQKSTILLTSLIDNMLEISSLDVSQEKLPCKEANLNSICIQEMTLLNRSHKPDIDYRTDLPIITPIITNRTGLKISG